jgi:hypothetical protein
MQCGGVKTAWVVAELNGYGKAGQKDSNGNLLAGKLPHLAVSPQLRQKAMLCRFQDWPHSGSRWCAGELGFLPRASTPPEGCMPKAKR